MGGLFMNLTALERAILAAGSAKALAKLLGVTPMTISHWKVRGVPACRAVMIEKATGVLRQDLRPDLYSSAA